MLDWNEARQICLQKLEPLSEKLTDCIELNHLCIGDLSEDFGLKISNLKNRLERQISSLRKGEFNIAAVGLEKAGKSTLLNAILGSDILPSAEKRCTYTTTELQAVRNIEDQKVKIEFFSSAEFFKNKEELDNLLKTFDEKNKKYASKIENDLKEINENLHKINKFLDKPNDESIKFESLNDDVKMAIRPYIADPGTSRAVKKITIFTTQLSKEKELIFHDVPGWDSPVILHQELAKRMLAHADVVLFVTNMSANVSLRDGEFSIMDTTSSEDPDIKVKDKVFVFLNHVDRCSNGKELEKRFSDAIQEWEALGYCSKDRIVPGSAYGYLVDIGQIKEDIDDKELPISSKIKNLNHALGKNKFSNLSHIDTGIEILKNKINNYLENERAMVLSKRCNSLEKEISELVRKISSEVNEIYSGLNIENIEIAKENDFNDWWIKEWQKIKSEFGDWYFKDILPKNSPDEETVNNVKLKELQDKYMEQIDIFSQKWKLTDKEFQDIYTENFGPGGTPQPLTAHTKIRKEYIMKIAYNDVEKMSECLSDVAQEIIDQIFDWVEKRLFNLPECKNLLVSKTKKQKEHIFFGMSALLRRFVKPIVESFLMTPRGTGERGALIKKLSRDIKIVESFYENGKPEKNKDLLSFLEFGIWIASFIPEPNIAFGTKIAKGGLDLLNAPTSNKNTNSYFDNNFQSEIKTASNLDEIKKEIYEDIDTLVKYLKYSVFEASGILSFCYQEIDKVRTSFYDLEDHDRKFAIYIRSAVLNNKIPTYSHKFKETDFERSQKILRLKNKM